MELKLYMIIHSIINLTMLDFPPFAVLQFKYKYNKYYALAAMVFIDFFITLPRTIGDAGPSLLNTILTCTHPVIWCIVVFKDPLWKKLAVPIGFTVFVMLPLEFISMLFMHLFWGGNFISDSYIRNDIYLAGLTLNNLLYFVTEIFMILLWHRLVDKKKSPQTPIYLAVALYQTVLFALWLAVGKDFSLKAITIGLLLEVFGFVIDIVLFIVFNQMGAKLETEEKLEALYRQRDFEKEYYTVSQQYLTQMKKLQTDFLSHIHEIHEAVKQPDNTKKIKQILDQSQLELNAAKRTVYSTNPVINAVLSVKQEQSAKQNIKMEVHCSHSLDIGIADIDLCSVLGNLLDNAIEACERIDVKERKITADIHEKAGFLVIKIRNSVTSENAKVRKIGYTSKADAENHGLGLRMVERICSKYDGKLILTPTPDEMRASAILKRTYNGKD